MQEKSRMFGVTRNSDEEKAPKRSSYFVKFLFPFITFHSSLSHFSSLSLIPFISLLSCIFFFLIYANLIFSLMFLFLFSIHALCPSSFLPSLLFRSLLSLFIRTSPTFVHVRESCITLGSIRVS